MLITEHYLLPREQMLLARKRVSFDKHWRWRWGVGWGETSDVTEV
jgi:hypothetical protein